MGDPWAASRCEGPPTVNLLQVAEGLKTEPIRLSRISSESWRVAGLNNNNNAKTDGAQPNRLPACLLATQPPRKSVNESVVFRAYTVGRCEQA